MLSAKAGDLVVLHPDTLHSTTYNTADPIRYFISAYFVRHGLPHRDEFQTPHIAALVAAAETAGNFMGRQPLSPSQ